MGHGSRLVIGISFLVLVGTVLVLIPIMLWIHAQQPETVKIGPVETKSVGYSIFAFLFVVPFCVACVMIGVACTFSWGRPKTTRIAMGSLSLAMIFMSLGVLLADEDERGGKRAVLFSGMIAICSGYYAVTGHYPESLPLAEVFGTTPPESVPATQAASIAQPKAVARPQAPPRRVACRCGQQLRASNGQAGQTVVCPACGSPVRLPV